MQNTETKRPRDGSAPDSQGTHFWFMTIQAPNAAGLYQNSYQGALTPKPGATRLDMFNEIKADIERMDPRSQRGMVMAFDIQPNEL